MAVRGQRYGISIVICMLLVTLSHWKWSKSSLLTNLSLRSARKVAFVILIDPRENHEENVIPMLGHMESMYGYTGQPYHIFIDGQLPSEAIQNATFAASNGKASWHMIDAQVGWGMPDWIDPKILNEKVPEMYRHHFPVGYHNMCRYFGGFAYSHPALRQFDYFWRLDSNVRYLCVPPYNPAAFVADNDLDYGFIHADSDAVVTLEGYEDVIRRFIAAEPELIHPNSNYRQWLFNETGNYTFITFYNNFEIISRRFFESKAYQTWFRFVDRNSTGIYSSRYGDAPIRSAGLSMLLDPRQVAWFGRQIGYEHEWQLATPEEPWKSLFCGQLPTKNKLPSNSVSNWYGNEQPVEPQFDPMWLPRLRQLKLAKLVFPSLSRKLPTSKNDRNVSKETAY